MFIPSPSHAFSSASMDRDGTSPSVYNNNDEFDATQNFIDAKMDAQMEKLKALINTGKRSSSSSRRRSSAHAFELPSPARSHRHRHHHRREEITTPTSRCPTTSKRDGQELHTNIGSMTSPLTLASSVRDFKASSPLDVRHLCRQAPHDYGQEKLPKLKSNTSTSYFDFDNADEIPFFGTHDPEEYLKLERKMDDYLKQHQVPSEDHVKCATRNFHDYASTWWLHMPSMSSHMSWPKTKMAMQREFVPSSYTEHLDANWRTPNKDPSPSTSTSWR